MLPISFVAIIAPKKIFPATVHSQSIFGRLKQVFHVGRRIPADACCVQIVSSARFIADAVTRLRSASAGCTAAVFRHPGHLLAVSRVALHARCQAICRRGATESHKGAR
jgi:hypothetical protein